MGSSCRAWACLGVALLAAPSHGGDEPRVLVVPATLEAEFEAGTSARAFRVRVDRTGDLLVEVRSFEFDPRVRVLGAGGDPAAEDDDGGIETCARARVRAESGVELVVLVSASEGTGKFELSVSEAAEPRPEGIELVRQAMAFRGAAAAHCEAVGRVATAVRHRLRQAHLLLALGRSQEALAAASSARRLARSVGDPALEIVATGLLASSHSAAGDRKRVRETVREARELLHPETPRALRAWVLAEAHVLSRTNDRASTREERSSDEDLRDLAAVWPEPSILHVAWQDLAEFSFRMGRNDESILRYQRALELTEDEDLLTRMRIRTMLQLPLRATGRYREALANLDSATDTAARLGHDDEAVILLNVGQIRFVLGDLWGAKRAYESSVRRSRGGLTCGPAELGLGQVLESLGRHEEARAAYERALEPLRRNARGAVYLAIGMLEMDAGRYGEARRALASANRLVRRDGARHQIAAVWNSFGYLHYLEGDYERAAELSGRSLDEFHALGRTEDQFKPLDTLARVALATGDLGSVRAYLDEARALLDEGPAAELTSELASMRRGHFAHFGAIEQDWIARKLSKAANAAARDARVREGLRLAADWKGRYLYEAIALRQSRGQDHVLREGGEARPEEAPDAHTAIVEYTQGLETVYAYVVTRNGVRHLDLGPLEDSRRSVEAFLANVADEGRGDARDVDREGRRLARRILRPVLETLPEGIQRIVVVPSEAVAAVPFEAIVLSDQEAMRFENIVFVLDRFEVVYAPSLRVFAALGALDRPDEFRRALVLGDPSLEGAVVPWRPDESLPALASSRDEALDVARTLAISEPESAARVLRELQEHARDEDVAITSPRLDLFLGAEVSRERLRGDLTGYTAFHFATHGVVDQVRLDRCGIVLGGTEKTLDLLTVHDVFELELRSAIVVLSACSTAAGPRRPSEGILSTGYAFLHAGSRAVVATLWPIEDRPSAELVDRMYKGRLDGSPFPEALRTAKLAKRQSTKRGVKGAGAADGPDHPAHPYYWAPFVYIGRP